MSGVDEALPAFRAFRALVMDVHPRDGWIEPMRRMHVVSELISDAPPGTRTALEALLAGGTASLRVPAWLGRAARKHVSEFHRFYTLSRTSWPLAFPALAHLHQRWPTLMAVLRKRGVDEAVLREMDRYMAVRFNSLLGAPETLRFLPSIPGAALSAAGDSAALKLRGAIENYARTHLAERGLALGALHGLPFHELDPFSKLLRLLPDNDPGWRQLGALAAKAKSEGRRVLAKDMQGLLGEIIALRTPGVLAFFEEETARILRRNPGLLKDGWSVLFQPNRVVMAQRDLKFVKGGKLREQGLAGAGESLDLSVWLVNEESGQAMVLLRAQVKAGTEGTTMRGMSQIQSDDWRMFSGFVTLEVAGKAKRFDLRPPDVFTEANVLIGADLPEARRLAGAVGAGSAVDVLALPLTGKECGMLGGIFSRQKL